MKWTKGRIIKICIFIIVFFVVEVFLIFLCSVLVKFKTYKNRVYPNTYLGEYKLSGVTYSNLDGRIDFYTDGVLNNKIVLKRGEDEFIYTFDNLGLDINKKAISDQIIKDQKNMKLIDKIKAVYGKRPTVYTFDLIYDTEKLREFLVGVKEKVDTSLVNDSLVMNENRELNYVPGHAGFYLDVDKSLELILLKLNKNVTDGVVIDLVGNIEEYKVNEEYKSIDSIVSSFTTEFNPYIVRATNLRTALGYVDGAIVEPGEIFSFFNYAGPYGKKGYVFYYEFVGNGVCQIATTVYNAALLGGLEIVKRYPHKAKSPYVAGGLDATVASYTGWNVDMQFKNTYNYPIYISAYYVGGVAHVDFWSNHDAKEGKTYSTESVQIGYRGYQTFLHTYKDGQEISRDLIATTWYLED